MITSTIVFFVLNENFAFLHAIGLNFNLLYKNQVIQKFLNLQMQK